MTVGTIGIFVFDDAEELDWAGPWEVLSSWALVAGRRRRGVHACPVAGAGHVRERPACAPDYSRETAPPINILIYPGGRGTERQLGDESTRGWVRALSANGTLMTSVCTGALVYADAGLLNGRPATTHWSALDQLGSLGERIEVRPDDRFVDDGDVITAAGVSAGIDMALHLVKRLHSEERAREVKRGIQYDPKPPV